MSDNATPEVTPTTAPEAEPTPEPLDGAGESVSKADFDKLLKDKRSANREAQDAKKRLAELEAKFQEIADKEKTDLEKANEKLAKLEKSIAEKDAAITKAGRIAAARDAGVDSSYAEYAAQKYAEEPDTPAEEFFAEFKKSHPAMFGGGGSAPGSGGGGPSIGGTDKAAKLTALNEEYKALLGRRGSDQVERRLMQISSEVQEIRKSMNSH